MLEQFVGLNEGQIQIKYAALQETDKEQFRKELLPFMNMLAKTMIDSGALVKPDKRNKGN